MYCRTLALENAPSVTVERGRCTINASSQDRPVITPEKPNMYIYTQIHKYKVNLVTNLYQITPNTKL